MLRSLTNLVRATSLWVLLLPGIVYFAGAASNQAVKIANNDAFPVKENIVKLLGDAQDNPELMKLNGEMRLLDPDSLVMLDDIHCVMTDKTHLNWLADIFDSGANISSVGDYLLDLGTWLGTFCPFVWGALVIGKIRRSISDARV